MNGINGISLPRDNSDLAFSENVGDRLLRLEAFLFRQLDESREFLSLDIPDENGKVEKVSISETQAFSYLFGSGEELKETIAEIEEIAKDGYRKELETAQAAKEQAAKAEQRALEVEQWKDGEEKKRTQKKKEQKEFLWRVTGGGGTEAQAKRAKEREEKKKAYNEALETAEKKEEEVYVSGGRMRKLAD